MMLALTFGQLREDMERKGGTAMVILEKTYWFKELACPTSRLVKGIVLLQKGGQCDVFWDQC